MNDQEKHADQFCGMQFKQCLEGDLQTHMHIQKRKTEINHQESISKLENIHQRKLKEGNSNDKIENQ